MGKKKSNKFEDLDVWKEAMQLVVKIYNEFEKCKDYSFKDQVQRSAVSIPSNIAEGYERQSDKDFIRYLYIAKASSGELRTQLYLAVKLKYLKNEIGTQLIESASKISSMLYRLIEYRSQNL